MMNINPLQQLMGIQYNDQPTPQTLNALKQLMLQQRGATAFRNVGPQDLTQFPDVNTYHPENVQSYRFFGQGQEGI